MKRFISAVLVTVLALGALAVFGACQPGEPDPVVDIGATPVPEKTETPVVEGLSLTRAYTDTMGMVAAGYIHSLGLRANGTALSAGHDYYGQRKVGEWANVVYIAAGKSVSVGVKADGTLLLAGTLTDAAALATAAGWTNVFTADAGGDHIAALLNDGSVVAAGDNTKGACDVTGWSDIVAIACGDAFTVGLKADGTLVATSGAPDVSAFKDIVKLAAGGEAGVAGITDEGKLVATCDMTGLDGYTDLIAVGVDDFGVACVRADGTVVSALSADVAADPDYSYGIVDLASVTDAVGIAVGTKHVVVMKRDGYAVAYGSTDDLQCDVGRFNLRPYIETLSDGTLALRGLNIGMTIPEARALIAAATGAADVQFARVAKAEDGTETETPCADTDIVATGIAVKCDGAAYATIAILGDVDGNGTVDAQDRTFIEGVSTGNTRPEGVIGRAAKLEKNLKGEPVCTEATLAIVDAYIAGTGAIPQYSALDTGIYSADYTQAVTNNKDTVGWIAIPKTNISYPIMFDTTGKWYYNDHTFEKEKSESGSIYAYYYGTPALWNTVVTGHNSRPSGSMYHQLHHIQEFNLGEANCAQKKYCGIELTALPDFNVYSNRVWTMYLYGEETRWEVFAMYETAGEGSSDKDIFMDNVWWRYGEDKYNKKTAEAVQMWIDTQINRSQLTFDTSVTTDDRYLTMFTCGNEHDDSSKWARLYYFLKQVD